MGAFTVLKVHPSGLCRVKIFFDKGSFMKKVFHKSLQKMQKKKKDDLAEK